MNTRKAFLGSACLQPAGERVLAIENFCVVFNARDVAMQNESLFRRAAAATDAKQPPGFQTSTRAAWAPENK